MTQSAMHASTENLLDSHDFNQNYRYLKRLIQELRVEDGKSLRKEIFGDEDSERSLTKKQMKQLFRFLRKIEHHYEECCTPPIPDELEQGIRAKDSSDWLPWELEAIEKADAWREELKDRKLKARQMLEEALNTIRRGEELR